MLAENLYSYTKCVFFKAKQPRILDNAVWDYWVRGFGLNAFTAAKLAICFIPCSLMSKV